MGQGLWRRMDSHIWASRSLVMISARRIRGLGRGLWAFTPDNYPPANATENSYTEAKKNCL
jgi:hypothetical protein